MRALRLVALLATLGVAAPASATSGIYTGLTFGYAKLSGTRLIITDNGADIPVTDSNTCCPDPGVATEFRLGFSIEGLVAPEFMFVAHGWDIGGDAGGAGYIGGGVRVFPIGLIGLAGLDVKDFPIIIGLGGALGYTVTGKDFAYSGSFFGFDITAEYVVTEVFSIGARFTVITPSYGDFAWTDYSGDRGRCLDANGAQDPTAPIIDKSSASCGGNGPSALYISPQLSMTFHFDVID